MAKKHLRSLSVRLFNKFRQKYRASLLPQSGRVEIERLGFTWRLDMETYIGHTIAEKGVFEPHTTRLIKDLVKPDMQVLDVGANIGYYSLLLARAVGSEGNVWAFEPTEKYRQQLIWHLEKNQLVSRVCVQPYGLSDKSATLNISVGDSSATLHWTKDANPLHQEKIQLFALDEIVDELGITRIDLIKLDIDGHEPNFIRGAAGTLQRFRPVLVLEFSQLNLHLAGSNVRQQARLLQDLGYILYNERTQEPYSSEVHFLMDCGNYNSSCNALAKYSSLNVSNSGGHLD